jgi:hypothetical protein
VEQPKAPKLIELAQKYGTDKAESNSYIENFERYFQPIRNKPIKLLELGVFRGQSLLMWEEYFHNGTIAGVDIAKNPLPEESSRIRFYQGSQDDSKLLSRIRGECAPNGFDIILDDASHIGTTSRNSFNILFRNHLKSGGIYVVEDWGTGYWSSWPDGKHYEPAEYSPSTAQRKIGQHWPVKLLKTCSLLRLGGKPSIDKYFSSHNHGMTGFIKELVDEVAWTDIAVHRYGNKRLEQRVSLIKEMSLYAGHAFITKA